MFKAALEYSYFMLIGAIEVEIHTIFQRSRKIIGPLPCIFPYCAFGVTANGRNRTKWFSDCCRKWSVSWLL